MVVVAGVVVVVGAGASKIEIKAYVSLSNINTQLQLERNAKIQIFLQIYVTWSRCSHCSRCWCSS